MIDEHFIISVMEYLAARVMAIAHNSVSPKMDIVSDEDGQQTRLLSPNSLEGYADAIQRVVWKSEDERLKMAAAARRRVGGFSVQRLSDDLEDIMNSSLETEERLCTLSDLNWRKKAEELLLGGFFLSDR
ncbi:hypothetical protein MLD38_038176 [Melastoma candidum]|uniref:Uncharacterized protein n=1 Tax=Melastoma candidum TaxID=119954 RepID=A0ACB9KZ34_9MYRT|nr:hypothetical protein MLD38_038176 [Melastoma candidum]